MMHCWQGWIYSATCMAFFSASDSTQWQSQLTSRKCSSGLASNHKTRTISVICGQRMARKRSSNTIDSFFGATCSPSYAIFVLQKCAKDNKQEYPEAHTSIVQQFYMNDSMQAYSSEGEARRNAEEIKTVLHTGGFNLTKFLSNKPAALENLMEEDKAEMKAQNTLPTDWPKFTRIPNQTIGTHPWKDESRWPRYTRPHPIKHTKSVAASTTRISKHTSTLLEFCRGQWSPHMRYTSDTSSDACHWAWKIFNKESTTQLY